MTKAKPIQISGKNLAALNMPDACPRCFWIKNTVKNLPFQMFPGIFASIDAYTKKSIHQYFDTHGQAPVWLPELKDAVRYLKVPHWSKFQRTDPSTGLVVTGVPDDLFECADSSLIIPDYKTAKYTDGQDKLLPIYIGQLNIYRWIHEGLGGKVRSLPLVYCEPITDEVLFGGYGFAMQFKPKTVMVDMDEMIAPRLISRAHEILTGGIPERLKDCSDCEKLTALQGKLV